MENETKLSHGGGKNFDEREGSYLRNYRSESLRDTDGLQSLRCAVGTVYSNIR
jgi:hypothetical protein